MNMKIKKNEFHVLATIANIYGTQEMIDEMIEGGAFSKRDALFASELLHELQYEPDWS